MGCSLSKRKAPEPMLGTAAASAPPPLTDTRHLRVKLVLLGDSGVGKTCLVTRFVRGSFDESSKVTVGVRGWEARALDFACTTPVACCSTTLLSLLAVRCRHAAA